MAKFRVDQDDAGNCEISPQKPQRLRPLEDNEAAAPAPKPKSAMKSALKGSAPAADAAPAPEPPAAKAPKSAMKSALKTRPPLPEPDEEPDAPSPAAAAAPKSALKRSPVEAPSEDAPRPPPGKPKSALKNRSAAAPEAPAAPAPKPKSAMKSAMKKAPAPPREEDEEPSALPNVGRGGSKSSRQNVPRPSAFKMNIGIVDSQAWGARGLVRHYFHFAGQKLLWEQATFGGEKTRKSIKLDDLVGLTGKGAEEEPKRSSTKGLTKGQSFVIEDKASSEKIEISHGEISPLKELFLAKKPDEKALRKLLKSLSEADVKKWVHAPLDATPPPMPAPLFSAVAGVHANLIEVLIEFGVNVSEQYPGKSMLKGWVKPNTPLVECVQGRKGRFLGTMLGDKLGKIEMMLVTAQSQGSGKPAEAKVEEAPPEPPPMMRGRRKSVKMKAAAGVIEHTHDHPSSKYELVGTHDDGNPSNIREAMHSETGQVYAVKAGSKFDESVADPEAALWSEIGVIRKMCHPNIVRLHETFENDSHIFMVLEGCLGGELFDRLVAEGRFAERDALRVGYQIGSALRHLHGVQVCHRDIQPETFFLAEEGPLNETGVKLIDFSTAREFSIDSRMQTKVCTLHYVAPEILTCADGYTEKVDIWSYGVLLYTMIAGAPPFNAESEMEILNLVKVGKFDYAPASVWSGVEDSTRDLINKCLTGNPEERPTTLGIMDHAAMQRAEADGAVYTASDVLGKSTSSTSVGTPKSSNTVKAAFSMMAEVISDAQVEELRALFKEADEDETGMVELEDTVEKLKEMVQHNSEATQAKDLLQLLNQGISGRVNYTMYLATMTDRRRHLRREAARAVFNNFDIDKNGNISLYEIAQALASQDHISLTKITNVSAKEVQKIWSEMREVFSTNPSEQLSDREMTFDEFFKQLPKSNMDIGF